MKKILPITMMLAVAATAFTACSDEEEDIFSQSAAERLNNISSIYTQRLCSSPGGWVMEYYPYTDNENEVTGIGYLILNRFHDNGSVYSFMRNSASLGMEFADSTAWEVITDMGPVLTFNTYNATVGFFASPSDIIGTSSDESGKGYQGDYEFVMVDVPENGQHIMLKGKKRGLYHRLTRLPQGTDFTAYLDTIDDFKSRMFANNARWELIMDNNGTRYNMNHLWRGNPTLYPEGTDSVTTGWREPFLITLYDDQFHLRFKDTIMVGDKQMEQEFYYSTDEDCFRGMTNNDNIITGDTVSRFMLTAINKGYNWQMTRNSEMSESVKALYETLYSDMRARSYNLSNIAVVNNTSKELCIRLAYTYNRRSSTLMLPISVSRNGDTVTFTRGETPETVQKFLDLFPSANNLVDFICQQLDAQPATTRFNLNTIKVVSKANAADWLIFTLR